MSAPTSLKAGDPVKAGEAVRVPVGTLEAGEIRGERFGCCRRESPFLAGYNPMQASVDATHLRIQRSREMKQNRAALPTPPAYAREAGE